MRIHDRRRRGGRRAAGLPAVALAAATLVLAPACSSTGEPAQTAATDVVVVDADGVTQTVVPATDGLAQVTVTTATFGEADGVDGVLELTVRAPGGVRTAAAAGADLRDNAPVTLAFEPLPGTAGRVVELHLRYAGREPLGLYVDPHDPYPDGRLAPGGGDLTFVLGHADRVAGAGRALARVVGEVGDKATGDPVFLAVWLLALAGAGVVTLRARR